MILFFTAVTSAMPRALWRWRKDAGWTWFWILSQMKLWKKNGTALPCSASSSSWLQKDIVRNIGLDMALFLRNVTFRSVKLYGLYRHNIALASKIFEEIMSLILKAWYTKVVTPIKIYKYSEMEDMFRFMQAGKHVGKIVFQPSWFRYVHFNDFQG